MCQAVLGIGVSGIRCLWYLFCGENRLVDNESGGPEGGPSHTRGEVFAGSGGALWRTGRALFPLTAGCSLW